MAIEVKCINKQDRPNPWERITHIGGTNPDDANWKITQASAIEGIENGKWEFYVDVGGSRVAVVVAVSQHGNKYIKTEPDDEDQNNLLSLPECP